LLLCSLFLYFLFFFFFSSRRRHTRSLRDWSSDVCSSDLGDGITGSPRLPLEPGFDRQPRAAAHPGVDPRDAVEDPERGAHAPRQDRKSTRLNSSHVEISYAVFCLKKKKKKEKIH